MPKRISALLPILLLAILAGAVYGASAADYTWTGAKDTSWTNVNAPASNWTGGSGNNFPGSVGAGDTATFTATASPVLDGNATITRLTVSAGTISLSTATSKVLTFDGTSPTIEVLAGGLTISCGITLAVDTTVFVATGASLTLSGAVNGPGKLTVSGGGAFSASDSTPPGTPTFSAPSVATTSDSTPTWTWASGGSGGIGIYRYQLDDSNLTASSATTTSTSFTPGAALGDGSHTLYVQERDAVGNWSSSGTKAVTVDTTAPHISARITRDVISVNGHIDAIEVTFDEAMSTGVSQVGTWTVAGYSTSTPTWQSSTVLRIPLTELSTYDTGAMPAVKYTRPGTAADVVDANGNPLASEASSTVSSDGAGPVILSVDANAGSSQLVVTFSEGVQHSGGGSIAAADVTYANNGGSGSSAISAVVDGNGTDASVTLTTNAAVAVDDLNLDTLAAKPANITDLSGNAAVANTVQLATPTAYFQSTVAGGDWNTAATWVQGRIPVSTDDVLVVGPVTVATGSYGDANTMTFSGAGSLACLGAPPSGSNYAMIRISGGSNQITALDDTSITDINIYDRSGFGASYDIVFTVAGGATLNLYGTTEGQWARTVVKRGSGLLIWDEPAAVYSPNFDDGPTRVEAGTFRLVRAGGRPNGYEFAVSGGATLDLRVDQGASALTGQGTVTRGTPGITLLTVAGGSWSGTIQNGSGSLQVSLSGANAWTGTNTFTGGLTLTGGSLDLSGTAAIADTCGVILSGGTMTVNDPEGTGPISGAGAVVLNGTLTVNQANAASTLSGVVSGAKGLVVSGSGSGALTLSGTNTYVGGTSIRTGAAVVVATGANLGDAAGPLVFDGGTLRLAGDVNLSASDATSTVDGSYPTTTITAAAADRAISITANDGTIDLATFSLGLKAFDTAAGQDLTIAAGTSGDRTLFVNVPAATTVTWAGKLASSGNPFGWFIKRGTGTLDLANATNSWSKSIVRPEEGTLRVSADGALGTVSSWVYTLAGATFELTANYSSGVTHYVAGTMQVSAGSVNWGGVTYAYPAATPTNTPTFSVASGATLNLSGTFTYTQPWAKTGAGTLVLSSGAGANNGLTAAGLVSGGTLQIARDDLLGPSSNQLTLSGGATLAVTAGFTTTRNLALGASGGAIDVATASTLTLTGGISGANPLTKSGAGTLILGGGANAQSLNTVTAGVLQVAANGALGAASAGVNLSGGSLATTATFSAGAGRGLAISAASTVDVAAGTTLTWPGVVSGGSPWAKTSTGALVLSGTNTFTGLLGINAGTVQAASAAALGTAAGGTVVADGSVLQIAAGYAMTEPLTLVGDGGGAGGLQLLAGSASLSGAVTLAPGSSGAAVAVATGANLALQGVISGSGGLKQLGGGTLTLGSASNTFAGSINIAGGTLQMAADGALGAAANTVVLNGGTLTPTAAVVFASRALQVTSSGGSISTGANTLTIPGLDTAAGQDLQVSGSGGLIIDTAGAGISTIAGALSGSGTVTKNGTGALVLQSSNDGVGPNPSYTGALVVSAGTFRINGSVAAASTCNVAASAYIAGNGTLGVLTVDGTIRPGGVGSAGVLRATTLNLDNGAILDFDLGSANDQLAVDGSATIAATVTLKITPFPSLAVFDSNTADYVLLTSSGSLVYPGGSIVFDSGIPDSAKNGVYNLVQSGTSVVMQRNRAPVVETAVDTTPGTTSTSTTPPAYTVGPPGSVALFSAAVGSGPANQLVKAVDPEGTATADEIVFTLKLDPSQGRIEWYSGSSWQQVSSDSTVSTIATWTQDDIDQGHVRYVSTGTSGGNDAILYSCQDQLGAESPLYLMRFTIQGSGPPVITGLPVTATWEEDPVKPGPWAALAPGASMTASTDPLDGGQLKITLLNGESGDELSFSGNGTSIANDNTVSLAGVPIGTLVATTSSLTVTLNQNATAARTAALLAAANFRTSNSAPLASGRSIEIRATDGNLSSGTTIVAFPLDIDLYNDPPDVSSTLVAALPGLTRTGTVTATDPEGVASGSLTFALVSSTTHGTLAFNAGTGDFTYTADFVSGTVTADVLEDAFVVSATDLPFDNSARQVVGGGAASRYDAHTTEHTVHIRITCGGSSLAFRNVPRMTVDDSTGGSFSYAPDMRLPAGAGTITYELIDPPAGVVLGSGTGELNFINGVISWPQVPSPGPIGYYRFGILATDPVTGSAAFQPIMLRVGPGGSNG